METFKRISMAVNGLSLFATGILYLVNPSFMYAVYGEILAGGVAYHLVRASSGGPLVTIGMAITFGAFRPEFQKTGLWIQLIAMSGFAIGRLVSFYAEGVAASDLFVGELIPEMGWAILAAWFLWRNSPPQVPNS